jgi:hypothetical protein
MENSSFNNTVFIANVSRTILPTIATASSQFIEFIFTTICAIGCALNLVCIYILKYPEFKGDTYKYLLMKLITQSLVLIFVSTSIVYNCLACSTSRTFAAQFYRLILSFVANAMSSMATFSDMALTYDRLLMFKQSSKLLFKMRFPIVSIAILALGVLLNFIFLMAFRVESATSQHAYVYVRTEFGSSPFYRIYSILLNILQSLISFVVLLFLNYFITIEFRKYISKKRNMIINKNVTRSNSKAKQTRFVEGSQTSISLAKRVESISAKSLRVKAPSNVESQAKFETHASPNNNSSELNFTLMILFSSLWFTLTRFIFLV